MYIQTDSSGKVLATLDQEWLDTLDEDTRTKSIEGFIEIPEDDIFRDGYDTYYIDGELFYVDNKESTYLRINELKKNLKETDYIAAKLADGLANCTSLDEMLSVSQSFNTEYAEVLKQRQEWRNEINELEAKIR